MNLAPMVPDWLTGIGILTPMQVGPSTGNFKGTQITEALSTVSNSCKSSVFHDPCQAQTQPFPIGQGGYGIDNLTPAQAIPNVFWDQHYTWDSASDLDVANQATCQAVCTQVYSCSGQSIATFTVTKTYSKAIATTGTGGQYPVTLVQVTKVAKP